MLNAKVEGGGRSCKGSDPEAIKLLRGGRTLRDGGEEGRALLFSDRVLAWLPEEAADGIDAEVIRLGGEYILPGFVDVHVHGARGVDVMDASDQAIDALSLAMAQSGTTAFLPASVTAPMPELEAAVEAVRRGMRRPLPGAGLLGLHLEGPWIEPAMRGAHPEAFIRMAPDADWVADRADVLRTVTYSPVLDPGHGFLKRLCALGIVPSLGHTTADFDTARSAIEAGARSITHLFNAQTGLHHRQLGVVGAAAVTNVMCELIADGHHICSELFEPLCRLIGTDRLILITDSIRAGGLPDGVYDFAGGRVRVEGGLPVQADGTIAGSSLSMNGAVRNFWRSTGRPLAEVADMASRNPARLLGLKRKGSLEPGCDADIVCLDAELEVVMTFVKGRRIV